ncbi:MAG: hypothetical protein M2R45_03753 [Verrucomicrobia subdivision 3 bacterium]|nr:hypothetical protein [Limisphaerales bacterium]MCS1416923.1 hypothetical protein [Limisphaerales bacterium]
MGELIALGIESHRNGAVGSVDETRVENDRQPLAIKTNENLIKVARVFTERKKAKARQLSPGAFGALQRIKDRRRRMVEKYGEAWVREIEAKADDEVLAEEQQD